MATTALVGILICALGFAGVVGTSVSPAADVKSILPPAHHVQPPVTTSTVAQPPGAAEATTSPPPPGQGVTAIGDSIMIDAAPYLQQICPAS